MHRLQRGRFLFAPGRARQDRALRRGNRVEVRMTATVPISLVERLNGIRATIQAACQRASRPFESVKLVAVSKTHPAETILDAIQAGRLDFGENAAEAPIPDVKVVNAAYAR